MWHQNAPSRLALLLTIALIILAISPNGECVKRDDLMSNDNLKEKGLESTPAAPPSQHAAPPSQKDAPPSQEVPPPPPSLPPMSPIVPSPIDSIPPPPMSPDLSPTPYPPPADLSPPSPAPYPPPADLSAPSPAPYPPPADLSPPSPTPYPPSADLSPPPTPYPPPADLSPPTPMLSPPLDLSPPSPMLSPPPLDLSPPSPMLSPPPLGLSPPPAMLSPPPVDLSSSPSMLPPSLSNASPSTPASSPNGLQVGFYKGKCPQNFDIEALIAAKVEKEFLNASSFILPHLLRLQFHDCFVHGCDASILIDGVATEKKADSNLSVKGYEFIEAVKTSIEAECPDIVSCADIIAIATKYALKLAGGPDYPVQTGRKDGLVSKAQDVNLPSPTLTVNQTIAVFKAKNFTSEEMVVLLGCHTVGVAHCKFFQDRIYEGSSGFDPLMDPTLREQLKSTCPQGSTISSNSTGLNQNSNPDKSHVFDNSFYDQITKQRGILPIDQALARDPLTSDIVLKLSLDANLFSSTLANAMVKLQAVEVLTGKKGEIRKVCSKFNTRK